MISKGSEKGNLSCLASNQMCKHVLLWVFCQFLVQIVKLDNKMSVHLFLGS